MEPPYQRIPLGPRSVLAVQDMGAVPCPPETFAAIMAQRQTSQYTFPYFGRQIPIPRGQLFFSFDPRLTGYPYSKTTIPAQLIQPNDVGPILDLMRSAVATAERAYDHMAQQLGWTSPRPVFNGILVNIYATGSDYVSPHSDDEGVLVPFAPIVTMSYGETRKFAVYKKGATRQHAHVDLKDQSVCVMAGAMQTEYEHSITKAATVGPRISLTVRAFRV